MTLPFEKGNGDQPPAGGSESRGRDPRGEGTGEVSDRQLDVRDH
jgi:hypothetical protein